MMLRIGIDTGGTFTDFVLMDGERVSVLKLPSTPDKPELAILQGLERILKPGDGYLLQHGSTVATNAFLERNGARCALITNQGFEDVIEIGRQNRPGLYSLEASLPEPLVDRKDRIGIKERTLWNGEQLIPLESKSLEWLKGKVSRLKPESVAVVLLYSYLNPENERRIAEALSGIEVPVSLSHQILPEFREYERTSTTVINAYVRPIMSRYLEALGSEEVVKQGNLTVMQSNGGSISSASAMVEPVRTLFSGPAGGVVGAFEVAQAAGFDRILTFDMGGTSTDVCLCDGRVETTNEATIDHYPVSIQTIGIHSIGAGGGSVAWVDQGGLLKVGPRSAGAVPGPICYGSGSELTVTDANVFLGRLDPDYFLGGEMKLSPEKIKPALEAMGDELAKVSDRTWQAEEIAEGIVKIANAQMERALRVISLQRGYDTRQFTLVTFGGAGGLHACELAEALLIPRVLVPLNPGTLSATGVLRADVVQDASLTVAIDTSQPNYLEKLKEQMATLVEGVGRKLEEQGFEKGRVKFEESVDARYLGQSYEINTPFLRDVLKEFHRRHEQFYGYSNSSLPVEFMNIRVRGRAKHPIPHLVEHPTVSETPPASSLVQEKMVVLRGKEESTRFYLRSELQAGNRFTGPAIILEYSSTTLVPSGFEARIDRSLNIVIESANASSRSRKPRPRRPRKG